MPILYNARVVAVLVACSELFHDLFNERTIEKRKNDVVYTHLMKRNLDFGTGLLWIIDNGCVIDRESMN